jgi:hypothetical protein
VNPLELNINNIKKNTETLIDDSKEVGVGVRFEHLTTTARVPKTDTG